MDLLDQPKKQLTNAPIALVALGIIIHLAAAAVAYTSRMLFGDVLFFQELPAEPAKYFLTAGYWAVYLATVFVIVRVFPPSKSVLTRVALYLLGTYVSLQLVQFTYEYYLYSGILVDQLLARGDWRLEGQARVYDRIIDSVSMGACYFVIWWQFIRR